MTTTIDSSARYAYLSGALSSTLRNLATDEHFLKLKSEAYRKDYVEKLIKDGEERSVKYASRIS